LNEFGCGDFSIFVSDFTKDALQFGDGHGIGGTDVQEETLETGQFDAVFVGSRRRGRDDFFFETSR
jgi:hypothetical protein